MIVTGLLIASRLRPIVPMTILVGGTLPFFCTIVGWRLVSLVCPKKWYPIGDDWLWGSYQKIVLFFFENISGVKLMLYGDTKRCFEKKERVLFISNHQCTVDWIVADMLAQRQGSVGHLRYMLKDILQYIPLYGWYFYQHGCVYVRRGGAFREEITNQELRNLATLPVPYWLVIFPEGTRFSSRKQKLIASGQQFCRDNDLPVLEHVLTPRSRGMQLALTHLGESIDAVYDVTIGYQVAKETGGEAPAMTDFLCAPGRKALHLRMDRIPIDEVPKDSADFKRWLHDRFKLKDDRLSSFYSDTSSSTSAVDSPTAAFGTLVEEDAVLPLSVSILPTVVTCAALTPLLFSRRYRQIFVGLYLAGSLGAILVTKALKAA